MRTRLTRAAARLATARHDLDAHPEHVHLQQRLTKAETDHVKIQALYDATPGGQRELQAAIQTEPDTTALSGLRDRLSAGERLRVE